MKSVPLGLPYTRRLMNPICKSDLLAAKALLLLSFLMPALKKKKNVMESNSSDTSRGKITITQVRGGVWIKVKMMWPPYTALREQVSVSQWRMVRVLNKQMRSLDGTGEPYKLF